MKHEYQQETEEKILSIQNILHKTYNKIHETLKHKIEQTKYEINLFFSYTPYTFLFLMFIQKIYLLYF